METGKITPKASNSELIKALGSIVRTGACPECGEEMEHVAQDNIIKCTQCLWWEPAGDDTMALPA